MLKIESYTLGPLDTNCYLVWDEEDKNHPAWIIDPADAGDFLSEQVLHHQLDLQAVILTHGHIDHLMGAAEVALNFDVPTFVHEKDQFLVDRSVESAKHWFDLEILPPPPTRSFESSSITLGSHKFSIIPTPGHTPGSVTLYCDDSNSEIETPIAFVGDVVFAQGYGRTDFSYASTKTLFKSIEKLGETLSPRTSVLSGHGEPFTWDGRL